ncbi:hypothetical protein DS901_16855 [Loktanella sp. D2R18]|uniref:hypothetical protein n=1 Tax=Rhodobacterales TaxID=204455 RepID=UPI000DE914B2|nr:MULTISPECIES: hypothetical protein [Rhodobacterales]MDO6591140.1 hypothetical protein [Yoonia sp. 1_MG-2023]RBW41417.1 hypothetical protein DS901_16855 [Loktanella sp. D2R18]
MSSDDFRIAFHIGAHKTATSHLQRSLLRASDELVEQGVRYYGPDHFRLPGRTISALFGLRERRAKRPPQDQLALMRKGADRIVFSEENFIGTLAHTISRDIEFGYPNANIKIAQLSRALGKPIDLFLSVRNPTAMINSIYSQLLRGNKILDFEDFKAMVPMTRGDWADLVTRLRETPGVGRLVVWTYEDYTALFDDICLAMLGTQITPVAHHVNPRLSAQAVAQILAQNDAGMQGELAKDAANAFPVENGFARFDGFSDREHDFADMAYRAQVDAIREMPGVTLLSQAVD